MDHEYKRSISVILQAVRLSFKDDLLVDVFRIWDCYAQDWITDSPVLFRFESNDVLIYRGSDGGMAFSIGPVDATSFPASEVRGDTSGMCLCWLRTQQYGHPNAIELAMADESRPLSFDP